MLRTGNTFSLLRVLAIAAAIAFFPSAISANPLPSCVDHAGMKSHAAPQPAGTLDTEWPGDSAKRTLSCCFAASYCHAWIETPGKCFCPDTTQEGLIYFSELPASFAYEPAAPPPKRFSPSIRT